MCRRRIALLAVLLIALGAASSACSSTSKVDHRATGVFGSAATVTPSPSTGHIVEPLTGLNQDLGAKGYVEREFFVSGRAHAFTSATSPADGRWKITPASTASYETRVVVRRPADATRFNGTVVVEWMNVSAGESAPDWDYLNPMLMRDGYAYVGVSAQALGVQGGAPLLGAAKASGSQAAQAAQATGGLVKAEPSRYGALHHPGDQYALDIFDQVGRAVLLYGPGLLGGDRPSHVVAAGESQSAFYLTTYADAIQPLSNTFDGIFIHSRGGSAAPLGGEPISVGGVHAVRIRTDLKVPVFMFETQTDLIQLGYAPAQQSNTARIRTWEVAGTSHADAYLIGGNPGILNCSAEINTGPQHYVVQAAFTAFATWINRGAAPPSPAPFVLATTNPATLALDAHGNVIGGVRTPAVDVPISTLSGAPSPGSSAICGLFGSTTPFSPATLAGLYGTKATYEQQYRQSLDRAIKAGYVLQADRTALLAQASVATLP